jgi:tetratricopeptide (TPR) repeat protein
LKEEWDKALTDYTALTRLDPKAEEVWLRRGQILGMKGEWSQCLGDFDEALRLNPKDEWALIARARLLAACPEAKYRDGKKAVDDAAAACKLSGWKNASHLHVLGMAWAEAGDFNAAIGWEQKALEDADYVKQYGEAAKYYIREYEAKRPIRVQAVLRATKKP